MARQATGQSAPGSGPARANAELKQQIKDVTQAAQEAAKEAAQDARQAAQDARSATANGDGFILVPPTPPSPYGRNEIPPQAVELAYGFFIMCGVIVIGWPLARAFGRRIERSKDVPAVNPAMNDQLARIEQAVDAMSIEIERISESQRFMAKLQNSAGSERVALPADRG